MKEIFHSVLAIDIENACRYSSDILQVAARFDNLQYAIVIWISNVS